MAYHEVVDSAKHSLLLLNNKDSSVYGGVGGMSTAYSIIYVHCIYYKDTLKIKQETIWLVCDKFKNVPGEQKYTQDRIFNNVALSNHHERDTSWRYQNIM